MANVSASLSLGSLALADERLRTGVQGTRLTIGGKAVEVTISVGVAYAQWPTKPATEQELLRAADAQLYEAKRGGRNCVRIDRRLAQAA